jgi:hypothetical protein
LENGRGAGLDTAVEARERGRAFGQEVAEAARESRDDAGRRDDRGPPDGVSPGPPDTAGPPNAPPGRPTPGTLGCSQRADDGLVHYRRILFSSCCICRCTESLGAP